MTKLERKVIAVLSTAIMAVSTMPVFGMSVYAAEPDATEEIVMDVEVTPEELDVTKEVMSEETTEDVSNEALTDENIEVETSTALAAVSGEFSYVELGDGTVAIDEYLGNATEVTFPATIDGKPVAQIGYIADVTSPTEDPYVFNDKAVAKITIPSSVTKIEYFAFAGSGLATVNFEAGSNLKEIGARAFASTAITQISLPESVTTIGGEAFAFTDIKTIALPEAVTEIEDGLFCECGELETVTFSSKLTKIGDEAFFGTAISSIVLPDTLVELGEYSFYWCKNLTTIDIPDGVKVIPDGCFNGSGITSINFGTGVTEIKRYALDCEIDNLVIPDSVTRLEYYCISANTVTFPNNLLHVSPTPTISKITNAEKVDGGYYAGSAFLSMDFEEGKCPEKLVIKEGTTTIGVLAISAGGELSDNAIFDNLKEVVLPSTLKSIGQAALLGAKNVKSIVIPESVYIIEPQAVGYTYANWDDNNASCEKTPEFGGEYRYYKIDDFVIYGHKGTEAEKYANENGFTFIDAVLSPEGNMFYFEDDGDIRCYDKNGNPVINEFKCDGTYTYYFQADGTAMKDRLTYHPDGVHVIYFDENGHEVFSDFANVKKSIAGDAVDDMCFFNVYGYMYVDTLTYDKTGTKLYYVNPYGVLERTGWFAFSGKEFDAGLGFSGRSGGYGYANADCSLMTNTYTYDWDGNYVYIQGDGHMFR